VVLVRGHEACTRPSSLCLLHFRSPRRQCPLRDSQEFQNSRVQESKSPSSGVRRAGGSGIVYSLVVVGRYYRWCSTVAHGHKGRRKKGRKLEVSVAAAIRLRVSSSSYPPLSSSFLLFLPFWPLDHPALIVSVLVGGLPCACQHKIRVHTLTVTE
jgi:hypothetical protein